MHNQRVRDLAIVASTAENVSRFGFLQPPDALRKNAGTASTNRAVGHYVDVINERYQTEMNVDRQDWVNDQTGLTRGIPAELGARVVNNMFKMVVDLSVAGQTGTGYDGAAFFSASHYQSQTNLLTATEVTALNVTTAAAPTPEEMVDAITGVIGYMKAAVDQKGEPMGENAQKFLVVCPATTLWAPAITAIRANNLASGQTSVLATLNEQGWDVDAIATPRLTDTDAFYVYRTDGMRTKPFIISENIPASIDILDESSDHYKKEGEFGFVASWYGNAAYGEPMHSAHCQLS